MPTYVGVTICCAAFTECVTANDISFPNPYLTSNAPQNIGLLQLIVLQTPISLRCFVTYIRERTAPHQFSLLHPQI